MQCQYGEARSVAQNGCERCICNNPCENIICGADTLCSIDLQTDERTGETLFTPVCRSGMQILHTADVVSVVYMKSFNQKILGVKPGECPEVSYDTYQESDDRCETECYTDADCSGNNKCCNVGCSRTCIQPYMPRPYTAAPAYTVNPIQGML